MDINTHQYESTVAHAARFGVSSSTVRRWWHHGDVEGVRRGSRIYIRKPVDAGRNPNASAIYTRISPGEPQNALDDRLTALRNAVQRDHPNSTIVAQYSDVGRGTLSGKPNLHHLLTKDDSWTVLYIEGAGVITGGSEAFDIVNRLVESQGRRLHIVQV